MGFLENEAEHNIDSKIIVKELKGRRKPSPRLLSESADCTELAALRTGFGRQSDMHAKRLSGSVVASGI